MKHTVDQEGCKVVVSAVGGFVVGEGGEAIAQLPTHPSSSHVKRDGGAAVVLPTNLSELVCERLEMPENANAENVYVAEVFEKGRGEPFARVVWYTPGIADALCGRACGHERMTNELHQMWCRDARPGSASNQPASGQNIELGFGVMPGQGRGAVEICGQSFMLPFPRNPELSTQFEPVLGNFLRDVSEVITFAMPSIDM